MEHEPYMRRALDEARQALEEGEIPIGAVVVDANGTVVGRGHNRTEALADPTAHAEMEAITAATQRLGAKYLKNCTLYVTVEPCVMCAGACGWAQLPRVVYGCSDVKRGYHTCASHGAFHPKTSILSGVLSGECARLMLDFFQGKRK